MLPNLGPMEMVMVMGAAVLLFGKRLPEVGRSLGKGIVEFKKGLRGFEDGLDFSSAISSHSVPRSTATDMGTRPADPIETTVPKFEAPTVASSAPVEPEPLVYEPQPAQD